MVIYAGRNSTDYFMNEWFMNEWSADFFLPSACDVFVKRMQIHMCLQLLAIYGQVAVKCRLLTHVVFEMASFESRLIDKLC